LFWVWLHNIRKLHEDLFLECKKPMMGLGESDLPHSGRPAVHVTWSGLTWVEEWCKTAEHITAQKSSMAQWYPCTDAEGHHGSQLRRRNDQSQTSLRWRLLISKALRLLRSMILLIRVRDRRGKPGAEGEDLQQMARPEGERPKKERYRHGPGDNHDDYANRRQRNLQLPVAKQRKFDLYKPD
jgi:hypothetical protein